MASLSGAISSKCILSSFPGKLLHPGFTQSDTNTARTTIDGDSISGAATSRSPDPGNAFFPTRRIKRRQSRDYSGRELPRLQISYRKGVQPSDAPRRRTAFRQLQINGPLQVCRSTTTVPLLAFLCFTAICYLKSPKCRVRLFGPIARVDFKTARLFKMQNFTNNCGVYLIIDP